MNTDDLDMDMVNLVKEAAALLGEVYDPAGALIFWSARINYLDGKRPCDIYREGDYEAMHTLIARLEALADGAFA